MSENREYKIIQTETWELIRIKSRGSFIEDAYSWYNQLYAYILLHKRRITDIRFEDELFVTLIPLCEIGNYTKGQLWDGRSTWSVYANIRFKEIKFANSGSFQIQDRDLRGRGLGSYVLSDLVQWVKQYHPNFAIKRLSVVGLDDKLPGDSEQREGLYEGVGFRLEISDDGDERSGVAIAENSLVLHENRNLKKVESITLGEFIKILEENCSLRKDQDNLTQSLERYRQQYLRLDNQLNLWRVVAVFFLMSTVVLWFFSYH